jgi:hypothetical protein
VYFDFVETFGTSSLLVLQISSLPLSEDAFYTNKVSNTKFYSMKDLYLRNIWTPLHVRMFCIFFPAAKREAEALCCRYLSLLHHKGISPFKHVPPALALKDLNFVHRVYVCLYVCMYVYTYVCVYVCVSYYSHK